MGVCPNEECHGNLDRLQKTVYGIDGNSGVSGKVKTLEVCVKNKVSRTWIYSSLLAVLILTAPSIYGVFAGTDRSEIKIETICSDREKAWEEQKKVNQAVHAQAEAVKDLAKDNHHGVDSVQKDISRIQKDVRDMRKDVKDLVKEIRVLHTTPPNNRNGRSPGR